MTKNKTRLRKDCYCYALVKTESPLQEALLQRGQNLLYQFNYALNTQGYTFDIPLQ